MITKLVKQMMELKQKNKAFLVFKVIISRISLDFSRTSSRR